MGIVTVCKIQVVACRTGIPKIVTPLLDLPNPLLDLLPFW